MEDRESVSSSKVMWFTENQLAKPGITEPNFVDTTLSEFQRYEFAYRERSFISHKGNIGHAHNSLIFEPLELNHGFSFLRNNVYKGHLFQHDNLRFYRPEHVFTDLFYVSGGSDEQSFYAKHAQRINQNLVTSLKYQIIRAPGVYSRLESNNTSFYGCVDYVTDNQRYQALGSFTWNRLINNESGGLKNHQGFEENEARDSVLLYNADGRYREMGVNIHQYYQLGFYRKTNNDNNLENDGLKSEIDTLVNNENNAINDNDTIIDEVFKEFVDFGRINHKFSYNRQSYIFDEDSPPYPFFNGFSNIDSLKTYDSTAVNKLSNSISYSNYKLMRKRHEFPLLFDIYLKHDIYNIEFPFDNEHEFSQFTQGMNMNFDPGRRLNFDGFYNYTFGGYNDGDFSAGLSAGTNSIRGRMSYFEKESPFIMNNFFSNYVFWDNEFDKTETVNAGLEYNHSYFNINLNAYQIDNWHFFNKEMLPEQADDSFIATSAGIRSSVNFWVFGFDNHIVYQYLTEDNYEQFPELVSYHSIYADLVLFDKALYARLGIDVGYNSPYNPQSYMPVYKQFYVQDHHETPHLLFIDAYLNAKISRARLFVKWQNIGSLIFDQPPIYTIPYYPLSESQIRFGVSWMFFD